jgi:hypothetical protein
MSPLDIIIVPVALYFSTVKVSLHCEIFGIILHWLIRLFTLGQSFICFYCWFVEYLNMWMLVKIGNVKGNATEKVI